VFLPPHDSESAPLLTLLVAHFIPVKLIPASHVTETIQISLRPLIAQCKKKIRDTITIEEWAKQPQKRRRRHDYGDLSLAVGLDTDSQSTAKCVKSDNVGSTNPQFFCNHMFMPMRRGPE
jgi:hypothetical protein